MQDLQNISFYYLSLNSQKTSEVSSDTESCNSSQIMDELQGVTSLIEKLTIQSEKAYSYIDAVSREIRVYILSFLDYKARRITAIACKSMRNDWLEFCKNDRFEVFRVLNSVQMKVSLLPPLLQKGIEIVMKVAPLHINLYEVEVDDGDLITIVSYFPQLRLLKIRDSSKLTDRGIHELKKLSLLEVLHIENCKKVTSCAFTGLAEKVSKLQTLIVKNSGFTKDNLREFSCCSSLQNICIEGGEIDDASLIPVIAKASRLQSLEITNSVLTKESIKELWNKSTLKSLQLRNSKINDECFQSAMPAWKTLDTLSLYESLISDNALELLAGLNKLRAIDIVECASVTGIHFNTFSERYPHLEKIEVGSELLKNEHIMNLFSCVGLRRLVVSYSPHITDAAFQNISKLKNLTSLSLVDLDVTDAVVDYILECPKLEALEISRCPKITGSTLQNISKKLPKLRLLFLSNTNISSVGLKYIFQCENLVALDLENVTSVQDRDYIGLSQLHRLRHLYLGSTMVGKKALEEISKCASLLLIDLTLCRTLENDYFKNFIQLKSLNNINLIDASVTHDVLQHLQRCPKLRRITLE